MCKNIFLGPIRDFQFQFVVGDDDREDMDAEIDISPLIDEEGQVEPCNPFVTASLHS